MSSVRTVSILVKGKVQGVWFRASTKAVADSLQLTGFVRNTMDGDVYIEASGNTQGINELITWCRRGPELARVDLVDITELDPCEFRNFEIRRD
jgi:acylphosphatase